MEISNWIGFKNKSYLVKMEKKLVLNEKQQMVDLNEDLVNFRLNLKVTPQKKGEYQAAIVKSIHNWRKSLQEQKNLNIN